MSTPAAESVAEPTAEPVAGSAAEPATAPAVEPATAPVAEPVTDPVTVLGIRHHGPGSARAVRAALDALAPDTVLIEGPADADPLVTFVDSPELTPPVTLLAYPADDPRDAAFWPMAVFSPEWQALRWAREHRVPVGFCDLPAAAQLHRRREVRQEPTKTDTAADPTDPTPDPTQDPTSADPLARLAAAAGYDDPERWWDDVVESRHDGLGAFAAITDAMAELRATLPDRRPEAERHYEAVREAHMRRRLRTALADGARRVAVVCGAWHAPALRHPLGPAAPDNRLLRGLPRRKTTLTWAPWTHARLAAASGYGAGVASPGWYHHLFTHPNQPVARWLTAVAARLRREDLPVSSAHVIEGVRLADTLAALRGRTLAGLAEVTDATLAVLVEGDPLRLDLVQRDLVVGDALGSVPAEAPSVPLAADIEARARQLRLRREASARQLDLDLRKDTDLGRSRLLHRLRILGIDWGEPGTSRTRSTGTFRESWLLTWRPELAIDIVLAAVWGTTVDGAATARLLADADSASVAELTAAVESALLADLHEAVPGLVGALDARTAGEHDVTVLMRGLPALVRAQRYGDVRGTDLTVLATVTEAMIVRICAGLPQVVTGLDLDAAAALRADVEGVHDAVRLLADDDAQRQWTVALTAVADREDVNGLLVGRAVRLLRDHGGMAGEEAGRRLGRALSVGAEVATKAAWLEGFLADGGHLLVHDPALLAVVDGWVCGLGEDDFVDVLPLVRRTFGAFPPPQRRAIADAAARGTRRPASAPVEPFDEQRALAAARTVALILGTAS